MSYKTAYNKIKCDILIVTIDTEHELPAILDNFDCIYSDFKFDPLRDIYYWTKSLQTKHHDRVDLIITCTIDQGVPEASAITMKYLENFDPKIAFMIGTAAGVEGKTRLGDVIICEKIRYYESERKELRGSKPRPKEKHTNKELNNSLRIFYGLLSVGEYNWRDYLNRYLTKKEDGNINLGKDSYWPTLRFGNIACGEKLFVDGSLNKLRETLDDKILAGETEGYGFAEACERRGIPWVLIRGVSDYGEPNSKDIIDKDKYHLPSVSAASSFCRVYIEQGLYLGTFQFGRLTYIKTESLKNSFKPIKVRTVLISVGDKNKLNILIPFFERNNIKIITTHGSYQFIRNYSNNVVLVNDYVGCESIAGTRGTLHPYILGAIKVDTNDTPNIDKLKKYDIEKIDMVFVNAKPVTLPDFDNATQILEYISDIQVGAPALLRWVIRQYENCLAITSPEDYDELITRLEKNSMELDPSYRLHYLRKSLKYLSERDRETQNFLEQTWSRDF